MGQDAAPAAKSSPLGEQNMCHEQSPGAKNNKEKAARPRSGQTALLFA
jgi:hypothetical protein